MRVLRRRAEIITLFALLLAGSIATAQAGPAEDGRAPWATVNVCDTADSPNTIGIRASMPGSRSGQEEMFMRFVVQYFSREDERWRRVADVGDSGHKLVGKGRRPRQSGRSLRIKPPSGESVLLRGWVSFQWRLDGEVVRRASEHTRKGHRSNVGDDPSGYSASTCTIAPDS